MRIIGLDYGTKTVGVAVSDALGLTAQGVETITRKEENKLRQTLARIEAIIEEYEVTKIVVGLPKNMNNTLGERAEACKDFADKLERRTGIPVVMWDERLSTVSAEHVLIESGVRRENRKAVIDKNIKTVIVAGGVAANQGLRNAMEKLTKELHVDLSIPPMKYCTDNATMVAAAGYYAYLDGRRADLTLNSKSQDKLR